MRSSTAGQSWLVAAFVEAIGQRMNTHGEPLDVVVGAGISGIMLRVVVLVGAAVAAIALSVATGASAQARTSESCKLSATQNGK